MKWILSAVTLQTSEQLGQDLHLSFPSSSLLLYCLCYILHICLVTMATQTFVICRKESCELSLAQGPASWAYLKRVTQGCKCNLLESLTAKIPNLMVTWEHVLRSLVVEMALILSGWIWFVLALDSPESSYRTGRTFYFTRAGQNTQDNKPPI